MTNQNRPAAGDRAPADADRPPVSRVGDELQERADDESTPAEEDDRAVAQVEREAFESAQEKGWDKSVKDR